MEKAAGRKGADNEGHEAQQDKIQDLRSRVIALEAENDILAESATREPELIAKVQRLTERVAELEEENRRLSLQVGESGGDSTSPSSSNFRAPSQGTAVVEDPAAPFVVPGDKQSSVRRAKTTLSNCHTGTNVLCARTCPTVPGIVASGGADKSLLVARVPMDSRSAEEETASAGWTELHRLRLPAPVLSMDFCPSMEGGVSFGEGGSRGGGEGRGLLLAGGMDGASHLINVDPSAAEEERGHDDGVPGGSSSSIVDDMGKNGVTLVASMKDHAKYVVVSRWAPDGRSFVTASHDKVVTLYTLRGQDGGVGGTGFEQVTRLYFPEAVETAEFVRGVGGALELVVSARGQPHLTYVNVETLDQRRDFRESSKLELAQQVSLNEKDWDTHVSFTVMSLAASPDGQYLLGATDKSRIFLWRVGSNARIRTLMGHTTDDYFQPRVVWEPSGLFSYCNSSLDNDVHVHCLASGRVVERLKGHRSVVRDMYQDPTRRELVTASYDKAVKIWRA